MKSIIPIIPDEELRRIRERHDFLLRSGVRVSMASLEYADSFLAMHSTTRDGFTKAYLPNIGEHVASLVVRRSIPQSDTLNPGDGICEYMMERLYRTARNWQDFPPYQFDI